jgi:AraC-like DNA-binding protein
VGLNEYKLKRGFKQMFGTTVFAYLTEQHLDLAKRYLLGTRRTPPRLLPSSSVCSRRTKGRAPEENRADIPELAPSPALDKLAGRVISSMEVWSEHRRQLA